MLSWQRRLYMLQPITVRPRRASVNMLKPPPAAVSPLDEYLAVADIRDAGKSPPLPLYGRPNRDAGGPADAPHQRLEHDPPANRRSPFQDQARRRHNRLPRSQRHAGKCPVNAPRMKARA